MFRTICSPRTWLLSALGVASLGCNPGIYGELIDDAPVRPFEVVPLTQGNPYGREAIKYPGGPGRDGRLLMVGDFIPVMSMVGLGVDLHGLSEHPELGAVQSMIAPLTDLDTTNFDGIAMVPSPIPGDPTPHALVAVTSSFDTFSSRIVRINLDTFARTELSEDDIITPRISTSATPGFGQDLDAFNLDGPQNQSDYEVAVGSQAGVLVYDTVGANVAQYEAARVSMGIAMDDPAGFAFTLCDELMGYRRIGHGNFGPGGAAAFVVAMPNELVLITDQAMTNSVGAPLYDCAARRIPNPSPSAESWGWELFTTDYNGDGFDDLFVGDPSRNIVEVYEGMANGLPNAPTFVMGPTADHFGTGEYGYSVDRANLGGGFGEALLVGAPGSDDGRTQDVGSVFVYPIDEFGQLDLENPIVLMDQTPQTGTRHGMWAGGLRQDEYEREEIVVLGSQGGRVHLQIDDLDPRD